YASNTWSIWSPVMRPSLAGCGQSTPLGEDDPPPAQCLPQLLYRLRRVAGEMVVEQDRCPPRPACAGPRGQRTPRRAPQSCTAGLFRLCVAGTALVCRVPFQGLRGLIRRSRPIAAQEGRPVPVAENGVSNRNPVAAERDAAHAP